MVHNLEVKLDGGMYLLKVNASFFSLYRLQIKHIIEK